MREILFQAKRKNWREPFCFPMPLTNFYINRSEHEIIGNVFDNPELLKGGLTCRN